MRIRELDGLRGIAVLAVISVHYLAWLPATGSKYGWLGVDLFFILSGFLITSILLELRNKEHYFKVFYARRAFRIFPPYYLALIIYLVASFAMGLRGSWTLWSRYIFYYSSLYVGQPPELHATPLVIPAAVALGLAVLWSLSVEEIYYTIWAPLVRYTSQAGFSLVLAGMIVVSPLLRLWLHTADYPELYTFYCRMDGLAYGSIVALLIRERRLFPEKWTRFDRWFDRATLIFLGVNVAFWLITRGEQSKTIVSTLGVTLADIGFALVAHTLIRNTGGEQLWVRIFRARWLRSIGMVSYTLYLCHYPLRYLAGDWVNRLHLGRQASALLTVVVGLALSLAVAYGSWYGMESRILRWKDRKVPSPTHPEIPVQPAA